MADFILGRLKFTFMGAWTSGYAYIKDDVVSVGGRTYVCTANHTSAATFSLDASSWKIMVDGMRWQGAWTSSTPYQINDIVNYSNTVYTCSTAHTSTSSFDSSKFQTFFALSGIFDAGLIT